MKMIDCPSCHQNISDQAEVCPHCGYPLAKKRQQKQVRNLGIGCLGIFVALILVVALASFFGGSAPEDAQKSEAPLSGTDRTISGDHYFGCSDRDVYQKLIGFLVEHDDAAFAKGLEAEVLTGECRMFQRGETVVIADTAIFSGMVKVRLKGDVAEYWTAVEAVKD
ncbi:MAG: zinc ribbon domain-containing protein [Candidatus Binataceae bacterium]